MSTTQHRRCAGHNQLALFHAPKGVEVNLTQHHLNASQFGPLPAMSVTLEAPPLLGCLQLVSSVR